MRQRAIELSIGSRVPERTPALRAVFLAVLALSGCGPTEVAGQPPAPARGQLPPTCTTDLDCATCGTRTGCACVLAPNDACGASEHPCVAAPCHTSSASCWQGRCVLRHTSAGPCASDRECEVRDDPCACDVFAALTSAPPDTRCGGRGCGGRPAKSQYRAYCDRTAQRCVLERAPPPSPPRG